MEKTIEFAIEEARLEGFELGLEFARFEGARWQSWSAGKELADAISQLREQIAQEIESRIDSDSDAKAFTIAADIARGQSSCFRFSEE